MSYNRTRTTVRNWSIRTTEYSVITCIFCLSISREYPLCLNQHQHLSFNCTYCNFFHFATIQHPHSNGLKHHDVLVLIVPLPILVKLTSFCAFNFYVSTGIWASNSWYLFQYIHTDQFNRVFFSSKCLWHSIPFADTRKYWAFHTCLWVSGISKARVFLQLNLF